MTNCIGQIKVVKFALFVKDAYKHYSKYFSKYKTFKPSLHWTFAHVAELIRKNHGYSLAEISENAFENFIKHSRYMTNETSRQTSFLDNAEDTMKAMYILSSYCMRKYVPHVRENFLGDDPESQQIRGFFVNGDAVTLTEMKWTVPLFD